MLFSRAQQSAVDPGTEADDKVMKEVSRILEAGVVAGLDLVPSILTKLLAQLKELVSLFVWIVPEEFYLPYPPSYCPQPTNLKKVITCPFQIVTGESYVQSLLTKGGE